MKNITLLTESDEIHRYMRGLWKTEEFRQSHDNFGFVHKIVDEFAWLPRFFFDASDPQNETSHSSFWWGGIQRRDYDSDAIHDLYYIHELQHAAAQLYVPNLEFENFKQKMIDNELLASTTSEIRIYFELPSLRAKAFPYEIYADRFLNDLKLQARWRQEPDRLIEELKLMRRNVMNTQAPRDQSEYWIRKFSAQNDAWASVWVDRYDMVEQAMVRLRDDCATVGRAAGLKNLMGWLASPAVSHGTDTPFPDEAKAFAGIYWKNKAIYAEEAAKIKHATPQNNLPPGDEPALG